ncbi:four helix bundle protein [Flagellimonas sp. HMM57]|uniref:four helix bundle protein n=1 Tax=unclassified Flagellimonas TaxID=2644544 RepID=UPI0013D6562B|nr:MULTISPECIES: four helix bundle protein [unclassified Flagellimonas]UII75483.1 four helix bundle protein [Flagellimonas sp. HMM57]
MHNFQDLIIWKKAMGFVEEIYKLTTSFPKDEKFGLKSQIRRSAVSIPSNIAEGAGRNTNGEFRNFLGIANGSINELSTQFLLSQKLCLISEDKISPILENLTEIQKINHSLIKKFKYQESKI